MTGIPGKTGIVYTLDRATGEFLWATPTIAQTVVGGIDGATGAVSENARSSSVPRARRSSPARPWSAARTESPYTDFREPQEYPYSLPKCRSQQPRKRQKTAGNARNGWQSRWHVTRAAAARSA